MRKLPSHISQYNDKFEEFVTGALKGILLPVINPYEVIRYKTSMDLFTNILYQKKTGKLTFTGNVSDDYYDFLATEEGEEA